MTPDDELYAVANYFHFPLGQSVTSMLSNQVYPSDSTNIHRNTSIVDYFGPREDLFDLLPENNQNSLQNVEICRNRTAMVVTPTGLVDYSILQSQNSKVDQPLKSLLVRRLQF